MMQSTVGFLTSSGHAGSALSRDVNGGGHPVILSLPQILIGSLLKLIEKFWEVRPQVESLTVHGCLHGVLQPFELATFICLLY